MINYKHPHLPELNCFIKHDYVHFYCNNVLYESTYKKITDENAIAGYLDRIFTDEKQLEALLCSLRKN
jgi:hypothetical protein